MLRRFLAAIAARFARPTGKALRAEMQGRTRRVDVTTFELKRKREDIGRTLGGGPS